MASLACAHDTRRPFARHGGCERTNTVATSIEVAPAGFISRRIFRCFRHTSHEALEAGGCYTAGDVHRWGMGVERGLQSGVSVDTPPVFEITCLRVTLNWTTPLPCFLWPIPPRSQLSLRAGSFFKTTNYCLFSTNFFSKSFCYSFFDNKKPCHR